MIGTLIPMNLTLYITGFYSLLHFSESLNKLVYLRTDI
jgi:hypothetical protein